MPTTTPTLPTHTQVPHRYPICIPTWPHTHPHTHPPLRHQTNELKRPKKGVGLVPAKPARSIALSRFRERVILMEHG